MKNQDNKRAKEFLSCLGSGKSIYQLESEDYFSDEQENLIKKQSAEDLERIDDFSQSNQSNLIKQKGDGT